MTEPKAQDTGLTSESNGETDRGYQDAPSGPVDESFSVASPLGPLRLHMSTLGLKRIEFAEPNPWDDASRVPVVAESADGTPQPVRYISDESANVVEQLYDYFDGVRREFDLPLDFSLLTGFRGEVQRALAQIPYGTTVTYGELAEKLGRPGAARSVGSACANNPLPIVLPCHRVVLAGRGLGKYSGPDGVKEYLHRLESSRLAADAAAGAGATVGAA